MQASEQRGPQALEVGHGGEDAAVAGPPDGHVEHVRPPVLEIAKSSARRQPIGSVEGSGHHAGRLGDPLANEVVVRAPRGHFQGDREHDECPVVVGERRSGGGSLGASFDRRHVVRGRRQAMDRDVHDVVVDVVVLVLVEVVTEAGSVGEHLPDRGGRVDRIEPLRQDAAQRGVQ